MKRKIVILIAFIFLFSLNGFIVNLKAFAADPTDTDIGYRMKPVVDKLASMTDQDIDNNVNRFKDMKTHWSHIQVGKLIGLDIIDGNKDGTFRPDDSLQADQFIKMLVCAMGFKPGVGKPYWAQTYIDVAKQYRLVYDGEFDTYTKAITREQMARILVRAAVLVETAYDVKYDRYVIGKIQDYASITDGCKQSVIDAYKFGLLNGSNGKFNPKGSLTRAEAVAVVIRFIDKKERKPILPSPDEILDISDNRGNMIEIYPGSVYEYFDVAKAMKDALPKAKGYVRFFINPENGIVFANFYKDEASYKDNTLKMIGGWEIDPDDPEYASKYPDSTVYNLTIYNDEFYKSLFAEYTYEILKTIFSKDSDKAIALHDKYMNMRNITFERTWEETKLNNRKTMAFREGEGFVFSASLLGKK